MNVMIKERIEDGVTVYDAKREIDINTFQPLITCKVDIKYSLELSQDIKAIHGIENAEDFFALTIGKKILADMAKSMVN